MERIEFRKDMDSHALDICVNNKRVGTLMWHDDRWRVEFRADKGLSPIIPVSLLEQIVEKKREIIEKIRQRLYTITEEQKNSWDRLREKASCFTPEGKDQYGESVNMVLKMIEFSEKIARDPLSDPQIVAMRDAVRCARYENAIDTAQSYYEQKYMPNHSECSPLLLDLLIQQEQVGTKTP